MNLQTSRKGMLFQLMSFQAQNKKKKIKKNGNRNNIKVILDKSEDIFYFTEFWGEGILIISDSDQSKLLVPRLEYTRALTKSKECEVICSERGKTLTGTLLNLINEDDIVYFNSNDHYTLKEVSKKVGARNLVIDDNTVKRVREIKDNYEIVKIKKASNIIDKLFDIAFDEIKVNRTEEEIQAILVFEAMKMGARFPSYQYTSNPLIIASGPNSSYPHAETSSRKIRKNEMIVLDITLSYDHYISDATRTFGIGKVTSKMKEVYEIVKVAQENGIEQLRKTNDFSEIDSKCRNIIEQQGFGKYFTHSTGHGIGLEVHELPWIRPKIRSKIQENMTITIEPGIYIENKYGIRIEDSLCITRRKRDEEYFDFMNFHSFDKDLMII